MLRWDGSVSNPRSWLWVSPVWGLADQENHMEHPNGCATNPHLYSSSAAVFWLQPRSLFISNVGTILGSLPHFPANKSCHRDLCASFPVPGIWVHHIFSGTHVYHLSPQGSMYIIYCPRDSCAEPPALLRVQSIWAQTILALTADSKHSCSKCIFKFYLFVRTHSSAFLLLLLSPRKSQNFLFPKCILQVIGLIDLRASDM